MQTLWQDLRYGVRMLLKRPGFTAVAMIALALGIGANSAIFSVVNAVLLRPLPFPEPERLVMVWGAHPQIGKETASFPDFVDWRNQNQVFEQMTAFHERSFNLTSEGEPVRILGGRASANFFSTLRVRMALGRTFIPADDQPGAERVAVVSRGLWQRRYGSDPDLIGKSITLNGDPYTVVGITAQEFQPPVEIEAWVPLALNVNQTGRRNDFLQVIARLKPGVALAQAQAEMAAIACRLEQQYPQTNGGWSVALVPLHEQLVGKVRRTLLVLFAAVGFVLLIACANVANLLLARAAAREKEFAIRAALGAGRFRLIRQLLTESILLSLISGACGLLLALWAKDLLLSLNPGSIPRLVQTGIDSRVLGFTCALSFLTGVVFGLAPALQVSKTGLNESLKEGGRSSAGGGRRGGVRGLLVVCEVALTLVLLVGAALMIKSFLRLQQVNPGFNPDHLLTMRLALPPAKYPDNRQVVTFYQQLLERVGALPGVQLAGVANALPISGGGPFWSFAITGRPPAGPGEVVDANIRIVSSGYLRTMGIPLLKGRTLSEQDGPDAPKVILINETLARRYWPNEDPLGKRVAFDGPPQAPNWRAIVGVVGDVKHSGLSDGEVPGMYVPHTQRPNGAMTLVVRAAGNLSSLASAVRGQVLALDRDQPVYSVRTMEQILVGSVAQPRFSMLLLGIFATVALILAAVGLYGVMSYSVTQRTHEVGVRMALGARPRDVLKLVVGQGMTLALIGVAIGLLGAFALTWLMKSLLFGVSATDPLTFAGIAVLLTLVALLACYLPARRATKVDPMVALRYE